MSVTSRAERCLELGAVPPNFHRRFGPRRPGSEDQFPAVAQPGEPPHAPEPSGIGSALRTGTDGGHPACKGPGRNPGSGVPDLDGARSLIDDDPYLWSCRVRRQSLRTGVAQGVGGVLDVFPVDREGIDIHGGTEQFQDVLADDDVGILHAAILPASSSNPASSTISSGGSGGLVVLARRSSFVLRSHSSFDIGT